MANLDHLSAETRKALAADQGILDTFGVTVESIGDGRCELICRVPENLINAGGFAHGSIAFAVMDTACAYAIRSAGVSGVTIHGDTHFVRGAAAGDKLLAQVEIVNIGRRVATLRGETYICADNGDRKLAAHGAFVFQLRR